MELAPVRSERPPLQGPAPALSEKEEKGVQSLHTRFPLPTETLTDTGPWCLGSPHWRATEMPPPMTPAGGAAANGHLRGTAQQRAQGSPSQSCGHRGAPPDLGPRETGVSGAGLPRQWSGSE